MLALLALKFSPPGLPRCWGWNEESQLGLGLGHKNNIGDTAGEVASLADVDLTWSWRTVVKLAAGEDHTCALIDDGYLCVPLPSLDWLLQRHIARCCELAPPHPP